MVVMEAENLSVVEVTGMEGMVVVVVVEAEVRVVLHHPVAEGQTIHRLLHLVLEDTRTTVVHLVEGVKIPHIQVQV